MRHMVVIVPELTSYASIRHVAVSLPYAAQLIDGVKYMEAKDVPALEGTELRRSRAPSLRFLVKQAVKCESAEQLGKKLRRRYQRQQARPRRGRARRNARQNACAGLSCTLPQLLPLPRLSKAAIDAD